MRTIKEYQIWAHTIAKAKGFWDSSRTFAEAIALIHSELSEALEAMRKGNPPSKFEGITQAEEELADVLIRIFDLARWMHFDLEEAVEAKMKYNESRPYKHGKEF